jgi:hypothetical protein
MQTLNININKARITGFQINLDEEKPGITATIELLTTTGKPITSYSLSSRSWSPDHFDIPIEMVGPILIIARQLEKIVTDKCQTTALQLEAPKVEL